MTLKALRTHLGVCSSLLLVSIAPVTGCASSPPDPFQTGEMVVLTINEDRITPAGDVEVPLFSSVCWFNATRSDDTEIRVSIEGTRGGSVDCSATIGFEHHEHRATTKNAIPPSQCAVHCFHETGIFKYVVTGAKKPIHGTIRVHDPNREKVR